MIIEGKFEKGEVPSLESLFEDFLHPNPKINQKAYMKMALYWPEESIDIFFANLDNKDLLMRRKCVKALGVFGQSIFSRVVELYFSTDNIILKISCLKIFVQTLKYMEGELFPESAMKVIESALNDDNYELTLTVIPLLKLLGEQGFPLLVKTCRDENVLKALASVMAISEIDEPSVKDYLCILSRDHSLDKLVRESSGQSLRNLRP